jgi:hypothetical protein
MIIKYRDYNQRWGWIAGVDEVTEIGNNNIADIQPSLYGCESIEQLGSSNIDSKKPYMIQVSMGTKKRMFALYVQEAYLTEGTTGSTIDILVIPNSR